jgi:hypothetical protein
MPAEISIIGDFPFQPTIPIADEVKMLQQGSWAPSSADFAGVVARAGASSVQVSEFSGFLNAIVSSPKKSIQKINIFTHANAGTVAFGGYIDSSAALTANVMLNVNSSQQTLIALDASALVFLRSRGTFGPNSNPQQFSLSDVRDRFMTGAQIIIFACHSGTDATLLQDLADTFGVTTIGFTSPIAYCPTFSASPPSIDRRMDIALGSCSSQHASNFHQLLTQVTSAQVTKVPKP